MNSSKKIFFIIEIMLAVVAIFQLFDNVVTVFFLMVAIFSLLYVFRKNNLTSFNQFQLTASSIVILICLTSTPAVIAMIIVAIFYAIFFVNSQRNDSFLKNAPWNKKKLHIIETTSSEEKSGKRYKRSWFGHQSFGNDAYEWDDINFSIIIGDTLVDLGNTLLPKADNVILIRKGFGKTRILVPTGTGVMLEHSSLRGRVVFEEEVYHLNNESIKCYSKDYDQANRRLKIVTNTLFGDIEVIEI